jgi:hypothetical protein
LNLGAQRSLEGFAGDGGAEIKSAALIAVEVGDAVFHGGIGLVLGLTRREEKTAKS